MPWHRPAVVAHQETALLRSERQDLGIGTAMQTPLGDGLEVDRGIEPSRRQDDPLIQIILGLETQRHARRTSVGCSRASRR